MENKMEVVKQSFNKSESIAAIAMAMAKAQAEMGKLIKNAKNPFFKNNYADLAAVLEACKETLNNHDIAVIQSPCGDNGLVGVTTLLAHKSGEWFEGTLLLSPTKKDPQGAGSCITYARRYSLAAMVGLAQEDDDAEGAVSRKSAAPSVSDNKRAVIQEQAESCTDIGELTALFNSLNKGEQEAMKGLFGKLRGNLARPS
jgi:hypothetical protein